MPQISAEFDVNK